MLPVAMGIDIGGTKIAAQLADMSGWHSETVTLPTPAKEGADAVLAAVTTICEQLREQATALGRDVLGIGIGSAGLVDVAHGRVIHASNIVGWSNVPIADVLQARLQLPVFVENDVRTMAIAENVFGAGKNQAHILFVAIGTGIGGAIVQHGKLWHGAHFSAGEIGYLLAAWDENGQPKSLENCAAGPALEHIYQQKTASPERLTLRQIAEAAGQGDSIAQAVIQAGARLTGQVLAASLCLLDPALLIIGGGVPQIGDLWWQPFETALRTSPLAMTRDIPVVQATLGTQAQIMGAALLALEPLA